MLDKKAGKKAFSSFQAEAFSSFQAIATNNQIFTLSFMAYHKKWLLLQMQVTINRKI